ncbi:MAG: cytochrome c biogenesis protein CcsA [Flavobacteriia bacterium]|nr:cytochrome c biogenesis protein CcsA [Flavobacteriia bacterium]
MEKIVSALFSMKMMTLGLFLFLSSIALATFLESIFDIQTAKIYVYNALWFEILLLTLCMQLIYSLFKYKLFRKEKWTSLLFHVSFIIIIIGAGVTRFFSFEGLMLIPEGTLSNTIYLSEPHLLIKIHDDKLQYTLNEKKYCSEVANNRFSYNIQFPNKKNKILISSRYFKKKQIDSLVQNPKYKSSVIELVEEGMQSIYLPQNKEISIGNLNIGFNIEKGNDINLFFKNDTLFAKSSNTVQRISMNKIRLLQNSTQLNNDSLYETFSPHQTFVFEPTHLYLIQGKQFVYKRLISNAKIVKMSSGKKDKGTDILGLFIKDGKSSKKIELEGGMGVIPTKNEFDLNGLHYELQYGSTPKEIPFQVLCRDFQLKNYPGSDMASSFASEVTVIDEKKQYKKKHRIFMNHVMDYGGYRFFQSSYDLDDPQTPENEEGTRLSVNYDFWGTNITYLGYLLMTIGMFFSLFSKNGRFKNLLHLIKKSHERRASLLKSVSLIFLLSSSAVIYSQHNHSTENQQTVRFITESHSEKLATLPVQDFQGRIIPFHTLCDQLIRKIHGKNKWNNYSAVQTVMSMQMYPEYWIRQEVIQVPRALQENLKLPPFVSYIDLYDTIKQQFKWLSSYQKAHQKLESKRNEAEKKIIKLGERFEVFNSILQWQYFKIIPLKNNPKNLWVNPLSQEFAQQDSVQFKQTFAYFSTLHKGDNAKTGHQTDKLLEWIKKYQKKIAGKLIPNKKQIYLEISYNKLQIFRLCMYLYFFIAFILLIVFFIRVFIQPTQLSEKRFKIWSTPLLIILFGVFIYHGTGLVLRWQISGHAPWSNGYEAIVFIAWVTVCSGFFFAKKNPIVPAATALLAYLMIFVSEMNLLDPEITPLQPVLKSYWLMIHVAVITASYGFLALGAILGFLNLCLYIFRTKINGNRITAHILEITYISELTITIGTFMLSIGTFLGGVWANESWGRYWGWDPKETWALVSILVYAIVLHLRFIPFLASKFVFNLFSFWAFSSILFTFFGVNFLLVGLHSYAQGEGLNQMPPWIIYTIFCFFLWCLLAYIRNKKYSTNVNS